MCYKCNHEKGNGDSEYPFSGVQIGQFAKWPNRKQLRSAKKNKRNSPEYIKTFKPVIQYLIHNFHQ